MAPPQPVPPVESAVQLPKVLSVIWDAELSQ